MQIEIFTIADSAYVDAGHGMSILHTHDTLGGPTFPLSSPQFCVPLKIHFRKSEEGQNSIRIVLIDDDGNVIAGPVDGVVTIEVKEGNETSSSALVLNFLAVKFKKPGTYWVRLYVNGREEADVPLYVRQIDQPAAE